VYNTHYIHASDIVECHLLHLETINSEQHLFSELPSAWQSAQQATQQRRPSYSQSGLSAQLETLKKSPVVACHTYQHKRQLPFLHPVMELVFIDGVD